MGIQQEGHSHQPFLVSLDHFLISITLVSINLTYLCNSIIMFQSTIVLIKLTHLNFLEGLHNIHGNLNLASLSPRNASLSGIPSPGVQQPGGNISGSRFPSNNLPVSMSQVCSPLLKSTKC